MADNKKREGIRLLPPILHTLCATVIPWYPAPEVVLQEPFLVQPTFAFPRRCKKSKHFYSHLTLKNKPQTNCIVYILSFSFSFPLLLVMPIGLFYKVRVRQF
jgi:hypothetical protein